jgi:hypothetical protein
MDSGRKKMHQARDFNILQIDFFTLYPSKKRSTRLQQKLDRASTCVANGSKLLNVESN